MSKFLSFFITVIILFKVKCDTSNLIGTITAKLKNISVLPKLSYVVSLKVQSLWDENEYYHICGGTILAERWILTAAHCFALRGLTVSRFAVDVGSEYRGNGTRYYVDNYYNHPNYSEQYSQNDPSHIEIIRNDVGLARLTKPIQFSPTMQPVRLGTIEDQKELSVVSGGWGRYSESGKGREKIRIVELKTMKLEECQKIHSTRNNLIDEKIHVCGYGGIGKTLCFGDSGGPLVDVQTGRQVGVSSGLEDCSGVFPVLFMRVEPFMGWINNVTKLNISLQLE